MLPDDEREEKKGASKRRGEKAREKERARERERAERRLESGGGEEGCYSRLRQNLGASEKERLRGV